MDAPLSSSSVSRSSNSTNGMKSLERGRRPHRNHPTCSTRPRARKQPNLPRRVGTEGFVMVYSPTLVPAAGLEGAGGRASPAVPETRRGSTGPHRERGRDRKTERDRKRERETAGVPMSHGPAHSAQQRIVLETSPLIGRHTLEEPAFMQED
ncbi:uncharacterized protein BJX67DRAFT_6216 [Aspergillus lucknowensis]|uniref:Uncharacterized protein n=1 Tax=Aspergillus lucknowensis TaxID=176173 RepID=A0ABR4M721_9EURO